MIEQALQLERSLLGLCVLLLVIQVTSGDDLLPVKPSLKYSCSIGNNLNSLVAEQLAAFS